jgi:hypothetical protein
VDLPTVIIYAKYLEKIKRIEENLLFIGSSNYSREVSYVQIDFIEM